MDEPCGAPVELQHALEKAPKKAPQGVVNHIERPRRIAPGAQ